MLHKQLLCLQFRFVDNAWAKSKLFRIFFDSGNGFDSVSPQLILRIGIGAALLHIIYMRVWSHLSMSDTTSTIDHRLNELQTLVRDAAADGAIEIAETVKWGQLSFVTPNGEGTTVRFGQPKGRDDICAVYVHCQTDLVGRWRSLYPDAFEYEGNRAVYVPSTGDVDTAALSHMISMALRYHASKQA